MIYVCLRSFIYSSAVVALLLLLLGSFCAQTSAFHMLCNWLGTAMYFCISGTEQQPIKRQQWGTLVTFSIVFSLNISVGNYSSLLVPVSFNQVGTGVVEPMCVCVGGGAFVIALVGDIGIVVVVGIGIDVVVGVVIIIGIVVVFLVIFVSVPMSVWVLLRLWSLLLSLVMSIVYR